MKKIKYTEEGLCEHITTLHIASLFCDIILVEYERAFPFSNCKTYLKADNKPLSSYGLRSAARLEIRVTIIYFKIKLLIEDALRSMNAIQIARVDLSACSST